MLGNGIRALPESQPLEREGGGRGEGVREHLESGICLAESPQSNLAKNADDACGNGRYVAGEETRVAST